MLLRLLTAPFTAPLQLVGWVGSTLENAAREQMNDTEALKQELADLERRLEAGELTEDEFEALEITIVRRLQEAAKRMAGGTRP